MKCKNCGFIKLDNPLSTLLTATNCGLMVLFLNHMTPDAEFYATWHWFMWWIYAVLAVAGAGLFLCQAALWLYDPHEYSAPFRPE